MSGADIYVAVTSTVSDTCEGHIDFDVETASIVFDALKIEL